MSSSVTGHELQTLCGCLCACRLCGVIHAEPRTWVSACPAVDFGKDHWSTLLYIETCCVDNAGRVDRARLRCNPERHPHFNSRHHPEWSDDYSTRFRSGERRIPGHDDWDVIEDLEHAGLLERLGTGAQPLFKLTDAGWRRVHALRRERAEGMLAALTQEL